MGANCSRSLTIKQYDINYVRKTIFPEFRSNMFVDVHTYINTNNLTKYSYIDFVLLLIQQLFKLKEELKLYVCNNNSKRALNMFCSVGDVFKINVELWDFESKSVKTQGLEKIKTEIDDNIRDAILKLTKLLFYHFKYFLKLMNIVLDNYIEGKCFKSKSIETTLNKLFDFIILKYIDPKNIEMFDDPNKYLWDNIVTFYYNSLTEFKDIIKDECFTFNDTVTEQKLKYLLFQDEIQIQQLLNEAKVKEIQSLIKQMPTFPGQSDNRKNQEMYDRISKNVKDMDNEKDFLSRLKELLDIKEPEITQGGKLSYQSQIKQIRKLLKNKKLTEKQKQQYHRKINSLKQKIEKQQKQDKIAILKDKIKKANTQLKSKKLTEKQKTTLQTRIMKYKKQINVLK